MEFDEARRNCRSNNLRFCFNNWCSFVLSKGTSAARRNTSTCARISTLSCCISSPSPKKPFFAKCRRVPSRAAAGPIVELRRHRPTSPADKIPCRHLYIMCVACTGTCTVHERKEISIVSDTRSIFVSYHKLASVFLGRLVLVSVSALLTHSAPVIGDSFLCGMSRFLLCLVLPFCRGRRRPLGIGNPSRQDNRCNVRKLMLFFFFV